ncbi:hypothetical protein GF345_03925 [Candidatus Woesearchaeota archaeon]|nr:hypothetical protein [Candidatus Woesearchaeota archaeon]
MIKKDNVSIKNYAPGEGEDEIKIAMTVRTLVQQGEYDTSLHWGQQIGAGKPFRIEKRGDLGINIKYPEKDVLKKGEKKDLTVEIEIPKFEKPLLKVFVINIEATPIIEREIPGQGSERIEVEEAKTSEWHVIDFTKELKGMKENMEKARKGAQELEENYKLMYNVLQGRWGRAASNTKKRLVLFLRELLNGKKNKEISETLRLIYDELKYDEERLKLAQMEGEDTQSNMDAHQKVKQKMNAVIQDSNQLQRIIDEDLKKELQGYADAELRNHQFVIGSIKDKKMEPSDVPDEHLMSFLSIFSKTEFFKVMGHLSGLSTMFTNDLKYLDYVVQMIEYLKNDTKKHTKRLDEELKQRQKELEQVMDITKSRLDELKPDDDLDEEAMAAAQSGQWAA